MWRCALMRWRMFRPEDQTPQTLVRVLNVYRNIINSLIITPEGVIVIKKGGNPSGSINTITDNTFVLYALMAYAWIQLVGLEKASHEEFERNTAKALCGDDNTWTVSDWAHKFYNARTVIAEWDKIGVSTTTDSLDPRPPEELDYLSARTVYVDNVAVPVYSREKLMTSLLYCKKKNVGPAQTLTRIGGILVNGWTDLQFRKFARELIAWLINKYDAVCCDDPDWIIAKCGVLSDDALKALWTGRHFSLTPFCLDSEVKRQLTPNKKLSMNNKGNIKSVPKAKKRANKKARRPRQQRNQVGGGLPKNPRRQRQRTRGPGQIKPNPRVGLNRRNCQIMEQEFIYDVVGNAGTFGVVNGGVPFPLNPGQATTFPWLSSIAKQWEKYRFNFVEIEYMREVSEFATAGTIGKVMVNVDLNAGDPAPGSKTQVLDTDERLLMSGMPCENFKRRIPGSLLHPTGLPLYVRPAGLPGAADIKTFDCGNIWVSTSGVSDNSTKLGELHIRYSVLLEVPILDSTLVAPANNQVAYLYQQTALTLTTTVAGTVLWPAGSHIYNGIAGSFDSGTGLILLPVGNYLIDYVVQFEATGTDTEWIVQWWAGSGPLGSTLSPSCDFNAVGADVTTGILSGSFYYPSDGVTTCRLRPIATFSTGNCAAIASLRVMLV